MVDTLKTETSSNTYAIFAWFIAVIGIFSQIIIFIKDIVIAQEYGISMSTDAYFYASQIPLIFLIALGGLGGPFHKATISIFSSITKQPKKEIQSLLDSFITLSALCLLVLGILTFIFSHNIIEFMISGASQGIQNLAVKHLQIMSPIILIGGIIGILSGFSNVYNDFFSTSLGPIVGGSIFIMIILIFGGFDSGMALATATLLAAVGQLLFQSLAFIVSGFMYKPKFDFKDAKLNKINKILIPFIFVAIASQLYIFADMYFVSGLTPGGWSSICYANKIILFVSGITITLFIVPLYPELSNYPKQYHSEILRTYFYKSADFVWFAVLPVVLFATFFANDIAGLVFQRGQFSSSDTINVGTILMFLSVMIIPYVLKDAFIRIFYLIDNIKTPLIITIVSIAAKTILNYVFINNLSLGVKGIVFSTIIVALLDIFLLAEFLKRKIDIDYSELMYSFIQVIKASALIAALIFGIKFYLGNSFPDLTIAIKLGTSALFIFISYFIIGFMLKIDTIKDVFGHIIGIFTDVSAFKSQKLLNNISYNMQDAKQIADSSKADLEHMYQELEQEKSKTDSILKNILPSEVADELKDKGKVKPMHYACTSVMFTDFEGYTKISKILTADELIQELEACFNGFDKICGKYKLEKIKTIGDSYMCVGGAPTQNKTHAIDCVLAAIKFQQFIEAERYIKEAKNLPYFNIRIGINSGEIIAGVMGTKKLSYDVWGDTVNLASRMESSSEAGKINISESTYNLVKDLFVCTYRGEIEVKNAGMVGMYFAESIKPEFAAPNNLWYPNKAFYEYYQELNK